MAGRSVLDIGEALREARSARGLSIEQAAQDTRISLRFLEALEAEEFEELPAPVYVRGFTRSYANYLGLDPQPLIDELALRENGGGYAARPGGGGFYSGPSRMNQRPVGSANPFQPRAPEPARAPTNVTAFPAATTADREEGDEDPSYDADAGDDQGGAEPYYETWEPPAGQRPIRNDQRTAGLLLEREAPTGSGGGRGGLVVAGLALAAFGALAAFLLLGGDDTPAAVGSESPEATSTSAGSVIEVRTPTIVGTPGSATRTTTPEASVSPTSTPDGSVTPSVTGTVQAGTSTVTRATPTTPPATPTTPAATATPTFTPTVEPPTPTPSPIVHPLTYSECLPLSGGERFCGSAPYLVICGPNGWFVDRDRDYLNPGWPTRELALLGSNVEAECSTP